MSCDFWKPKSVIPKRGYNCLFMKHHQSQNLKNRRKGKGPLTFINKGRRSKTGLKKKNQNPNKRIRIGWGSGSQRKSGFLRNRKEIVKSNTIVF